MSFYKKKDDETYFPLIRLVLEKRPSYGYKRITTLINRILKSSGVHDQSQRVYRLMTMNGLTLPKIAKIRTNHAGTGKVMTLHSNTRWCSDAFEIKCFSGEKVYVAFSIDCRDREAIHFVATREPLTQKHISELMIFSADKRFALRALGYSLDKIREFNLTLGLVPGHLIPNYHRYEAPGRLHNKFYYGSFDFNGVEYPGKHPLIIPPQTLKGVRESFENGYWGRTGAIDEAPFAGGQGCSGRP